MNQYWVYILHCQNGAYYTGYTTDMTRRYEEHVNGLGSKYTRSFKPIGIAQCWCVSDKSLAMTIECYIKKLSKRGKALLVADPNALVRQFAGVRLFF